MTKEIHQKNLRKYMANIPLIFNSHNYISILIVPYRCFHSSLYILKLMKEHNKHSLLQPLIIPISSPSSSSYLLHDEIDQHNNYDTNKDNLFSSISEHNIILRIILVLFVALISLWANYEASKIFDITIVNDIKDSPAGRRFALFYVSTQAPSRNNSFTLTTTIVRRIRRST